MVNMLIVDDEIIIQKGLSKIPWHTVQVNLIGTAGSGAEALKIIRSQNIHILFTDIQMPDINGLELIKAAKILNPEIQGVILTGHSNFSYAKEAVSLQVFDYILKPCNPGEVLTIIGRLASKIEAHIKNQALFADTIQKLQENQCQNYLPQLVLSPHPSSILESNPSLLPDNLRNSCWFQVCVTDSQEKLLSCSAATVSEDKKGCYTFSYNSKKIILFYSNRESSLGAEDLKRLWLNHSCRPEDGIIRIGVGEGVSSLEKLNCSYEQAEIAFSLFFSHRDTDLLFYSDIKSLLCTEIPDSIIKDCLFAIEHCNYNAVSNSLDQLRKFYQTRYILPTHIHIVFIDLCIFACNLAAQKREKSFTGLTAEQLLMITNAKDLAELIFRTEFLFFRCIDILNNSCNMPASKIIQDCQNYIKKYYAQDINLTKAAETLHINPDYLGRLLKKECSLSFGQLLSGVRLEQACRLLSDINIPISEIALSVGFKDFRHFGQVFKSRYQMTPTQYRKMLVNRNS